MKRALGSFLYHLNGLDFWHIISYQLLNFCYLIFYMMEFQKCLHGLSNRWSKLGVTHYKKENFVLESFDAIMMKLGQLIDFDKRKNLQEVSLFSHNLCVFFILALKSLLWRYNSIFCRPEYLLLFHGVI